MFPKLEVRCVLRMDTVRVWCSTCRNDYCYRTRRWTPIECG